MAALFRCQTIEQHLIRCWLTARGVAQEDVAGVEFLARGRVKVTNPAGQHMTLEYRDGRVWLHQTPEHKGEAT